MAKKAVPPATKKARPTGGEEAPARAGEETATPVSNADREQPRVYISYSHKDKALLNRLVSHLAVLEREQLITVFYDERLLPGSNWLTELNQQLDRTQIVLFLVSADALASKSVAREIKIAIDRQRKGEVTIIPVLLRPTVWEDSELGWFTCLPRNAVPVSEWENRDAAFLDVISGLRAVIGRGVSQAFKAVKLSEQHQSAVRAVEVTADGSRAISGSDDGDIRVWDIDNMRVSLKVESGSRAITGLALAPDQTRVLVAASGGDLAIWDLRSGTLVRSIPGRLNETIKVCWLDNELLVQVDTSGHVSIFVALDTAPGGPSGPTVGSAVTAAALVPDRPQLITGHGDGICRLWDIGSLEKVREFKHVGSPIRAVAASADAGIVAAVDVSNVLVVWNLDTAVEQRRKIPFASASGSSSEITGLAMPERATVVIAWKNGNIEVYDVPSGTSSTVRSPLTDLLCLKVTPDGKRAVTGQGDGSVTVWNLSDATPGVSAALPIGNARIELAYFAVLDNPQLFEVLESFDESVLTAVVLQSGGSAEEALAALKARHGGATPPLWSAWRQTAHGRQRHKT
jgi:WD40 repeat protein